MVKKTKTKKISSMKKPAKVPTKKTKAPTKKPAKTPTKKTKAPTKKPARPAAKARPLSPPAASGAIVTGTDPCVCGESPEEHGRDPQYPGSTACTLVGCECIAYEADPQETETPCEDEHTVAMTDDHAPVHEDEDDEEDDEED